MDEHHCPACPMEVRAVYATAHNVVAEWLHLRYAHEQGLPWDWNRLMRKIDELRVDVEQMAPIVNQHFEDVGMMRPNLTITND